MIAQKNILCYIFHVKPIYIPIILALAACSSSNTVSIEREDLATFNIGVFEDELDLYDIEERGAERPTTFTMRDGQFFISNGSGAKIVRYNSYGDLLFMIYNAELNPPPMTLKEKVEGMSETRWAIAWDLREPSHIAVDAQKNIYVVDRLPPERHSVDGVEKAVLDSIVVCFDNTGRFLEYLGQEGRGGTPFSRVEGIWTTNDDGLVVICRTGKGIKAFCYDSQGNLGTTIQFRNDKLPVPKDMHGVITSFESASVAPDEAVMYLKINYYREIFDPVVNTSAGVEAAGSSLWVVDMGNGEYLRDIELPFYESVTTKNNKKTSEKFLYSLFGASQGGKLFLYAPVEEGFSILVLQTDDLKKQRRGVIKVNPDELRYLTFNVSADGVLSALLADSFTVHLAWWRTDKLAREM